MRRASKSPWVIRRIEPENPKGLFRFCFTRCTKIPYLLRAIDTGIFVSPKFLVQNSLSIQIPKARGPIYDKLGRGVLERTCQRADT